MLVYMILTCQLLVVLCFVLFCTFHKPTQEWLANHTFMVWIAGGISLVTVILLSCFVDFRRRPPWNYVFLGLFTVATGLLLGFLAGCYAPYPVLMSISVTAIITLVVSVFALQTKFDFTPWGSILLCFSLPTIILGIVYFFFPNEILNYVFSAISCALYSCSLLYGTQLMMIGKHAYTYSPDDYVFAALNLYVDVVNIFKSLIGMTGKPKANSS